jgi:hypothetical protein
MDCFATERMLAAERGSVLVWALLALWENVQAVMRIWICALSHLKIQCADLLWTIATLTRIVMESRLIVRRMFACPPEQFVMTVIPVREKTRVTEVGYAEA